MRAFDMLYFDVPHLDEDLDRAQDEFWCKYQFIYDELDHPAMVCRSSEEEALWRDHSAGLL